MHRYQKAQLQMSNVNFKCEIICPFCGFRGSCIKSDNCAQQMSLESAKVGAEEFEKFENKKNLKIMKFERS